MSEGLYQLRKFHNGLASSEEASFDAEELTQALSILIEELSADQREADQELGEVVEDLRQVRQGVRRRREEAWDEGWEAHRQQELKQSQDPTHPIYRDNPYRSES